MKLDSEIESRPRRVCGERRPVESARESETCSVSKRETLCAGAWTQARNLDRIRGRERLRRDGTVEQAPIGHLAHDAGWITATIRRAAQHLGEVDRGDRRPGCDCVGNHVGALLVAKVGQQRRRIEDRRGHLLEILQIRLGSTLGKQFIDHRLRAGQQADEHSSTLLCHRAVWTQAQRPILIGAQQQSAPRLQTKLGPHRGRKDDTTSIPYDYLTLCVGHIQIVPRLVLIPQTRGSGRS